MSVFEEGDVYEAPTKQNKPFKVNDDGTERVIWDSRSTAVGVYTFVKNNNGDWFVLANKRGEGCPDFNGYWNCPCGYLDWGETERAAGSREIYEETGIYVMPKQIEIYDCSANPEFNCENVSFRLYTVLNQTVEELVKRFSKENMEENEVDDIRFIRVEDIYQYKWAFNHDKNIMDIFNTRINISFWKRIIFNLFNKYCYAA